MALAIILVLFLGIVEHDLERQRLEFLLVGRRNIVVRQVQAREVAQLRALQQRQYAYARTRFDVAAMVRNTLAFYREAAGLAPLSPPQARPVAAHA